MPSLLHPKAHSFCKSVMHVIGKYAREDEKKEFDTEFEMFLNIEDDLEQLLKQVRKRIQKGDPSFLNK